MKKFLLLTLFVPFMISAVESKRTSDDSKGTFKDDLAKLEKFMEMKFNHKQAWLDYMKNHATKSLDLKEQQMKEWYEFKKAHLEKFAKGETAEQLIRSKFEDGIKLYKKECAAWKEFMESEYKRAQELGESQHNEFNKQFPGENEVVEKKSGFFNKLFPSKK